MQKYFLKLFTPRIFINIYNYSLLPSMIIGSILFSAGLYFALFNSPLDYQQGEYVRIMYVHVPFAHLSMIIYLIIGLLSIIAITHEVKLAYIYAASLGEIGVIFAFLTLITGMIWAKPIWGTWWVWDARLTSMLILFMQYLGYVSITNSNEIISKSYKPASVIAIIGLINIPIIKFSVNIWASLHQPSSLIRYGGPSIDGSMLLPLFIMFSGFCFYSFVIFLLNTRTRLYQLQNKI